MGMHSFCLATCTRSLCLLANHSQYWFRIISGSVFSCSCLTWCIQPFSLCDPCLSGCSLLVPLHLLNISVLYSLRLAFRCLLTWSHSGHFFFPSPFLIFQFLYQLNTLCFLQWFPHSSDFQAYLLFSLQLSSPICCSEILSITASMKCWWNLQVLAHN